MRIPKSKFVAGVQCFKRLYWQVYEPELAAQPDASAEAIFEQGRNVGLLAPQLLPGGVEVASSSGGLDDAIRTTRELVANGEVSSRLSSSISRVGMSRSFVGSSSRRTSAGWSIS